MLIREVENDLQEHSLFHSRLQTVRVHFFRNLYSRTKNGEQGLILCHLLALKNPLSRFSLLCNIPRQSARILRDHLQEFLVESQECH